MIDFDSLDLTDDTPGGPTDSGGPLSEHLLLHDAGRVWDLGPAAVDTDDDGIADTLTRAGSDGLVIFTDCDHDGEVDKVTSIAADGTYESVTRDTAGGPWRATDSGRLG
ncbi:hypothetical protein GOEFS_018_00420 [Gordonia effusa NBRC 100432]|uniref:DUF6802 domain-containing protein n=1 Tax=Gordonia effusa NBRC 100432 TaxID=1077974 RepID=H0QW08_9ACTN|nr:DUF6802 family protein [Gordonia effusa]GAB17009.1 hypothetical protein GOEFS_018_00420 [Gordonia effusa NBRC 100432]